MLNFIVFCIGICAGLGISELINVYVDKFAPTTRKRGVHRV